MGRDLKGNYLWPAMWNNAFAEDDPENPRLADEYGVTCAFEPVNVFTARWIGGGSREMLEQFRERAYDSLALDHAGELVYLAPSRINLGLTIERWPELAFRETREHLAVAA